VTLLESALARLSEKTRKRAAAWAVLRVAGYDTREIVAVLGVTRRTLYADREELRRALAEVLAEDGADEKEILDLLGESARRYFPNPALHADIRGER
jgi:AcrR family transcriptional regulator